MWETWLSHDALRLRATCDVTEKNIEVRNEPHANLVKLHTTELGAGSVGKDAVDDVVRWCREQIRNPEVEVRKNVHVRFGDCEITIHTRSCTFITAHVFCQ